MSDAGLNIRPILPTEHSSVLQLWEESVSASHDFITKKDIDHYKEMIAESLVNFELFAVDEGDEMQGFIALSNQKIQMLFVHPNAFRRGFGKRLIQYAVQVHRAWLVDVNAQNEQALSFYLSMGFRIYHKFPNDSAGKPYPVWSLRLKRNLSGKQRWKAWRKLLSSLFRN